MRTAAESLRDRVEQLRKLRGFSQTAIARALGDSQASVSRKLHSKQGIHLDDLDRLATRLGVTVPELFFDEYGQWDRRTGNDRRKGERRQASQTIYDPKAELTPAIARLSFPSEK